MTIGIASAVLLFDVLVIGRRQHEPSRRELIVALSVYIGLAILFGIGSLCSPVRSTAPSCSRAS
ncbi:hypothetical protein ACWZJV_27270 [Nocardioides sp. WG-D5]